MHYSLRKAARRVALSYSNCTLKSHGGFHKIYPKQSATFQPYYRWKYKRQKSGRIRKHIQRHGNVTTGFYGQIKDAYMSLQNVWSGTTYRQSPDRMQDIPRPGSVPALILVCDLPLLRFWREPAEQHLPYVQEALAAKAAAVQAKAAAGFEPLIFACQPIVLFLSPSLPILPPNQHQQENHFRPKLLFPFILLLVHIVTFDLYYYVGSPRDQIVLQQTYGPFLISRDSSICELTSQIDQSHEIRNRAIIINQPHL